MSHITVDEKGYQGMHYEYNLNLDFLEFLRDKHMGHDEYKEAWEEFEKWQERDIKKDA